jgi:type VI secretion system Hcp family effector
MASKPVSTLNPPAFYGDVNMRGYNSILTIDGMDGFSQFCEKGIDIISFDFGITAGEAESSKAGGVGSSRVAFKGVRIRKGIDRATPLLFKAVAERQQIANAGIFLFRDPQGGGKTSEHFYTISLGEVFVSLQHLIDPEGSEAGGIPYEEVTLTANSIEFNHVKAKKVASILLTQGR